MTVRVAVVDENEIFRRGVVGGSALLATHDQGAGCLDPGRALLAYTRLDKTKADVETLLGPPAMFGYWTKAKPPEGANAAAITAFEAEALDEIWIYTSGRAHFTIAGKAAKVDDKVDRDLPPEEGTLVA